MFCLHPPRSLLLPDSSFKAWVLSVLREGVSRKNPEPFLLGKKPHCSGQMLQQPDRKSCNGKTAPKAEASHPQGHLCQPQRAACRSWCCQGDPEQTWACSVLSGLLLLPSIQPFPGMHVRALSPEAAEGEDEAQRCSFFHGTLGDPIPALSSLGVWHCPSQPLKVSFSTHALNQVFIPDMWPCLMQELLLETRIWEIWDLFSHIS